MSDAYSLFLDRPNSMLSLIFNSLESIDLPLPLADTSSCDPHSSSISDLSFDYQYLPHLIESNSYLYQSSNKLPTMELMSGTSRGFHASNSFQQGYPDYPSSMLDEIRFNNMSMPVFLSPTTEFMPQRNPHMESIMMTSYFPQQNQDIISHNHRAISAPSGLVYGMATSGGESTNNSTTLVGTNVENAFDMNPIRREAPASHVVSFVGSDEFTQANSTTPVVSQSGLVKSSLNGQVVSANAASTTFVGTMAGSIEEHMPKTPLNKNAIVKRRSMPDTFASSPSSNNLSCKGSLASYGMARALVRNAGRVHHNFPAEQIAAGESSSSCKIVRGITTGGAPTRPPAERKPGYDYLPLKLVIEGALTNELCFLQWNANEITDRRRIIRIERTQRGTVLHVLFLIVGLALANPEPAPAAAGVDVLEFSCLECLSSEVGENLGAGARSKSFYVTSVEIVAIVEMLIGILDMDAMLRRKERGRIRSNLTPFWLKRPISSKRNNQFDHLNPRMVFARRIMAYNVRKPRGFDKDVRILPWENLIPALNRALQCYYVEVPEE